MADRRWLARLRQGPGRRVVLLGVAATILFQLSVLATQYLRSVWPLWFGQPVRLQTLPVDPRSLFRGHYVRLRYAIGSPGHEVPVHCQPRRGQRAYLALRPVDGLWQAAALYCRPPAQGRFIRGRVESAGPPYRLNYGIEAYFLPRERAETRSCEAADCRGRRRPARRPTLGCRRRGC